MPSNCRCRDVVCVLLTPRRCKPPAADEILSYGPVYLLRYSEVAEVGNQCFHHCRSLLTGNGVGFRPLGKIVHSDQDVLVSLVASWEGPCYIDGYPFEQAPTLYWCIWPWLLVRGLRLAAQVLHCWHHFSASFLPRASCTFAGPYPWSCWHPNDLLADHIVQSARRSLRGRILWALFDRPSADTVVLWYAVLHSECFSLEPIAFLCGAAVGDIFTFWVLFSLLWFLQNGPYVLVVQLFPSQGGWIPAGYNRNSLYLLYICPHLDLVTVYTIFSAWPSRKGIGIVIFRPRRSSGVKLYSCMRWIQLAVCPSRFLKLISQVSAEWSVRRWTSCP
jgi:hypothetical protein